MISKKYIKKAVKDWGKVGDILLICRTPPNKKWLLISNLSNDANYKAAQIVLANLFNEYMAYANCGTEYRFIRKSSLEDYKLTS